MRRKLALLLPLILLIGAMSLSSPASAFASNPTDPDGNLYTSNLAGRPLNGYAANQGGPNYTPLFWANPCFPSFCWDYYIGYGTGHVIAYAKYGGYIVAVYPWHGRADPSYDGKYVYGPNRSKIGY